MSDNWITLIPEDPRHVPEPARRKRAHEWFERLAPDSHSIEIELSEGVRFFDCGANFERIACPSCGADLPVDWWKMRMDDDFESGGFALARYPTPCCGASLSLHDLRYEWMMGFGRFALSAMNPQLGPLSAEAVAEFERILATKLRVIYQHL